MFDSIKHLSIILRFIIDDYSNSFRFVLFPIPDVCDFVCRPLPLSVLNPCHKIPFVHIIVVPDEHPFTLRFIIDVIANVYSKLKSFESRSVFEIVVKVPLIEPVGAVYDQPITMYEIVGYISQKVNLRFDF